MRLPPISIFRSLIRLPYRKNSPKPPERKEILIYLDRYYTKIGGSSEYNISNSDLHITIFYQRSSHEEIAMKWFKGKFITSGTLELELKHIPLEDRARVRKEIREEAMLFSMYGIMTTKVKRPEAWDLLVENTKYGKFVCGGPSPLRTCWSFVGNLHRNGRRD